MSFGVGAIVFWYLVTETFIYLTDYNGIHELGQHDDEMVNLYGFGVLSEPTASIDYTTLLEFG
jgi:hypothetical protein